MSLTQRFTWTSAVFGLTLSCLAGGCMVTDLESEEAALADEAVIERDPSIDPSADPSAESMGCVQACNQARLECEFDCTQYYDTSDPALMACMNQCRIEHTQCRAECASASHSFAPPVHPDDPATDTDTELACGPDAQGGCGNEWACDSLCRRVTGEPFGVCVAGCCYCAIDY